MLTRGRGGSGVTEGVGADAIFTAAVASAASEHHTHPSTPSAPVPPAAPASGTMAQNSVVRAAELNIVSCSVVSSSPLVWLHLHPDGPHMLPSRAVLVSGPACHMKELTHKHRNEQWLSPWLTT